MSEFIEFSKPFVEGIQKVFETMVFTKLEPGKPIIKSDRQAKGDISAIMGLTGTVEVGGEDREFQGMFLLTWETEVYVKIASAMLMEEYTDFNDQIEDVGAEIANIVTGNAKRTLAQMGFKIEMAVPSTVTGKGHCFKYPSGTTTIMVPLTCGHGEFVMELCYQSHND